ncbi:MAG TPA: serine hydrolase [Ramlibacter sp.]|nr:serine hydrolase [Ramlibacter sp.]
MRSSIKKSLSLVALVAALVAGATLGPIAYRKRQAEPQDSAVAALPAPEAEPEAAIPEPPPGTEVVPPEESETDRGPASASPAGPTLSFARAAGLHLAPDPLRLNSSVALLLNQDTGEVLVGKNDQAVVPIASLTKLMTALLVIESSQPLDEVLKITEEDVDTERHSRSRLKVGTALTRQQALRLALMSSENRAAHALGRSYPGGVPKMVEAMNARAQQLGMKNTTYVDPTGLSNRNQSTARDVAVLVGVVARNPVLAEYSTTPAHLASLGGRTLQYVNSNRLVRNRKASWNIELQKTGYIVEAGRCLTMLTDVGGHDLIMVLLDADSNGARTADAERMRRWVVAQYGIPEAVAEARNKDDKPVRKVARKKDREAKGTGVAATKAPAKKSGGKTEAVAAKKGSAKKDLVVKKNPGKSSVAGKKADGKSSVASKKHEERKPARVRQSFAGAKSDQKS